MSTVTTLGDPRGPETIRFRMTRRQRAGQLLPMAFVLAGQLVFRIQRASEHLPAPQMPSAERDATNFATALSLTVLVTLIPLLVLQTRWFGITLTPAEAQVHNLRRRHIRWADVQGVTVEKVLGGRTVILHEAGGRRTRLRAPLTAPLSRDRRFDEKFHTIGQWWLTHRGPDWTPKPLHWQ
jgi:hypothetical protein